MGDNENSNENSLGSWEDETSVDDIFMTMISQKYHNCVVLENNTPNCVTAPAETANMVSC